MNIDPETTATYDAISEEVCKGWGEFTPVARLAGENFNLLVRASGGESLVLRVATDPEVDVDLETAMLEKLAAAGVPVPTIVLDRENATDRSVLLDGRSVRIRIHRFLRGTSWRDAPASTALGRAIGETLAAIHTSLIGFEPDGGRRTHGWDIATCTQHRDAIHFVEDAERRRILDSVLHEQAAIVVPGLAQCASGMLHGDTNDENLLVEQDAVIGVLDLGDALHGAFVQDLGIALAYAAQHPDAQDLTLSAAIVEGYHRKRPLTAAERSLLFPLLRSRLASSALVGARRRAKAVQHATWFSHEESTWGALERLATRSPLEGEHALCRNLDVAMIPAPDVPALHEARRRTAGPNLSVSYNSPLHIVKGQGCYLYASDGRPYLDLVNNVCHVGHCHPRVVEALSRQASSLNTNTRYLHEGFVEYASMLTERLPGPLDTVFLVTSGSEANELALRLAQAATGASDVLVIDGAYHGHTGRCVAMSPYKFNGPGGAGKPDWVHVAPSPDHYRGQVNGEGSAVGTAYADKLAATLSDAQRRGRSIAGFFAEPILSCGGQIPLPKGYLPAAFEHVRHAGGLCIADEVQVGFGRVGDAFWGFELDKADGGRETIPDIVVMGKPIGNGHPMGAVCTTRAIAESFANGMEFFSTFGGNPVSCAVGKAVLDVIDDEQLQNRALTLGRHFFHGLLGLKDRHEVVGDVRGRGLFLGIEFVRDRETLEPAADLADAVVQAMRARGVLLSTDGPLHNVIKIKPPLVLDAGDIDMTVRLLDESIAEAVASPTVSR